MKTFEEPVIEIKALILIISQFVKVNELRYKQCWVIPHFSIYWKVCEKHMANWHYLLI